VKIVFVNHQDFRSNSAVHIFAIANELSACGIECTVTVPSRRQTVHKLGKPLFEALTYEESLQKLKATASPDTLVYAWTPREIVRKHTLKLTELLHAPYMVHMEDNEESILQSQTGLSADELNILTEDRLAEAVGNHCSHPRHYQEFLAEAAGVSVIIDSLKDFVPQPQSTVTLWPGYNSDMFKPFPRNNRLRRRHGISSTDFLAVYTGGTHSSNQKEVDELYHAINLARQQGIPARLIRTGQHPHRLRNKLLRKTPHYCKELGYVKRSQLPSILAMADVLVQPGTPGPFNDYRFPSKLTEFFAMGKPVILPNTNIGRFMQDRENCLLLHNGSPDEIAEKISELHKNRALADTLSKNGRKFAEKEFQWKHTAAKMLEFIQHQLQSQIPKQEA